MLLRKIAIAAAAFLLMAGLGYAELVRDWRTPVAEQPLRFVLGASTAMLMADYNRLQAAMKQKYGERVEVSVPVSGPPGPDIGVARVELDGKILETHLLNRLSDVTGLFVVPEEVAPIRFPFKLAPDQNLDSLDRPKAAYLKRGFSRSPAAWFDFADTDWTIDRCSSQRSGLGLGVLGDMLGLADGTSCVVSWNGQRHGTMLVFVGRADGKRWWLGAFSNRLCRDIVEATLRRLDQPHGLDYAACVLDDEMAGPGLRRPFGAAYAMKPNDVLTRIRSF